MHLCIKEGWHLISLSGVVSDEKGTLDYPSVTLMNAAVVLGHDSIEDFEKRTYRIGVIQYVKLSDSGEFTPVLKDGSNDSLVLLLTLDGNYRIPSEKYYLQAGSCINLSMSQARESKILAVENSSILAFY